jgi:hypothetical protein
MTLSIRRQRNTRNAGTCILAGGGCVFEWIWLILQPIRPCFSSAYPFSSSVNIKKRTKALDGFGFIQLGEVFEVRTGTCKSFATKDRDKPSPLLYAPNPRLQYLPFLTKPPIT